MLLSSMLRVSGLRLRRCGEGSGRAQLVRLGPNSRQVCAAAQGQRDQGRRGDSRGSGGGRGYGGQSRSDRPGPAPGRGSGPPPRKPKAEPLKPFRPVLVQLEDPSNGRFLDCLLRRRIKLSDGREAGLLTPLDTPINVLRGDESEDMLDLEDAELESVSDILEEELLTNRGLLLQRSAFCLTVRGAVRYNSEDVLELEDGDDEDSLAVEILSFSSGPDDFLVYVPLDPIVLLATPNATGSWQALLGTDEEEEPALMEALARLNEELSEMAQEI